MKNRPGIYLCHFRGLYFGPFFFTLSVMSATIDEDGLRLDLQGWRLVTDGVMGGVSNGRLELTEQDGSPCLHMTGEVSTRNNGGFIQAVFDLEDFDRPTLASYRGVWLRVRGNAQQYNLHLRTHGLSFPWQAYRVTFEAGPGWSVLHIPFSAFVPYKISNQLDRGRISRIGIVAIGRDFSADVCVSGIGFFR